MLAALGTAAAAETPHEAGASSAKLARVADAFWRRTQEENLDVARLVDRPPAHRPPVSAARCEADARNARRGLADLAALDAKTLSAAERISLEMLRWEFGDRIEGARYYWLQPVLTPYSTPLNSAQALFAGYALAKPADLDGYRRLLGELPSMIGALETFTRGQAARGIVLPRDELSAVVALLDSYIAEARKSPFFVADERVQRLDSQTAHSFQDEVTQVIDKRVNPAIRSLREYLAGAYRDKAPTAVGLFQYPQGKEYYRYLVRHHTTLDLSPEQVHERGLKAVAELEAQMDRVRGEAGFGGSATEFRRFLREDRRFYAATPAEVETRLAQPVAEARAALDRFFPAIPKAPYGLRRLDPSLEGAQTFGYYDPPSASDPKDYYNYNAAHPEQRSLLEARSIILHELLPGHHLQMSLQLENSALPEFRRLGFPTAYLEGWGTYASRLGIEMGLYGDPYDRYGQLTAELFMAVRLVVDTGMNYYAWPRERAAAYMREHLILSDAQIASETLRYAVDMPGQALAYRIGEEALIAMRERAAKQAGTTFDVRRFHGCVLGQGAMPLSVLEHHLAACLAADEQ
ncbi:MAG: DUF885 domain-containing protein [Rudaea sp.]|nr:DUF885 domain-containing protein [Rudaea sp.]